MGVGRGGYGDTTAGRPEKTKILTRLETVKRERVYLGGESVCMGTDWGGVRERATCFGDIF